MIPALHPTYSPAQACEALSCDGRVLPVGDCRKRGCGFRWQREGAEDRARREEKDAVHRHGDVDHRDDEHVHGEQAGEPPACLTVDCIGQSNPIEVCERTRCPFVSERRTPGGRA
ncbi:MAG: hypothetical protein ACYC24_08790 [Desulfobacteria bacterium]